MIKVQECKLLDLGLIDFQEACVYQKRVHEQVSTGRIPQAVLACEHPAVITHSRRFNKDNILVSDKALAALGVEVYYADRGGDVTFHAPGQLVFYPIFDLRYHKKDLHLYLRGLEESIIRPLRHHFGLNAHRKAGATGVWVGPYKVASIGIGVKNWVTYHGFSLNVSVDKKYYSLIRPCGLDTKVASLNDFFDDFVTTEAIKEMLLESIKEVFGFDFKRRA